MVLDFDTPDRLWISLGIFADTEYMTDRKFDPDRRASWTGNYIRGISKSSVKRRRGRTFSGFLMLGCERMIDYVIRLIRRKAASLDSGPIRRLRPEDIGIAPFRPG